MPELNLDWFYSRTIIPYWRKPENVVLSYIPGCLSKLPEADPNKKLSTASVSIFVKYSLDLVAFACYFQTQKTDETIQWKNWQFGNM